MRTALASLLLTSCALSQAPDLPVIRTTTRLVQVNVVVTEKNQPVADLKKEDFVLFDGKKERKIATFSVETSKSTLPGSIGKLPPNVFVNSIDLRAETPTSITVILLDGLNTAITDQLYARTQVMKFLGSLRPEDRVAIYSLGRSLQIVHDFTSDPRQLARIIAKYRGRPDNELGPVTTVDSPLASTGGGGGLDASDAQMEQIMAEMMQTINDFNQVMRVRTTTLALEAIANHIAPLPGRKNLVWISSSFPLTLGLDGDNSNITRDRRTFTQEVDRAVRALNNANMAVYAVDARGLFVPGMDFSQPRTAPRPGAPPNIAAMAREARAGMDSMQELASRTGGLAFLNTNDIAGSVRRAIDDTEVTYALGFYPDPGDLDGKYHELKVQVPSRKGLNVRFRKGYFAHNATPLSDQVRKEEFRLALWSPLPATGINLAVHLERTDKPEPSLTLKFVVGARELTLAQTGERWTGAIHVMVAQLDPQAKILASTDDMVNLNLTSESYPRYLKTGMPFSKVVQARPGVQQVRLIVMDHATGLLGSVIIPIT